MDATQPAGGPLAVAPPALELAAVSPAGELRVPGPEGETLLASSLLFAAIAAGDAAGLQRLFALGATTDVRSPTGQTPLIFAILRRDAAATDAILAKGADTNLASTPDGVTPLFLALRQGNFALATRLLNQGANVNVKDAAGETPLTEAEKQRPPNYAAVRLLLARTASATTSAPDLTLADAAGQTPLQVAQATVSTCSRGQSDQFHVFSFF
jgi:ankyrin repeat protein